MKFTKEQILFNVIRVVLGFIFIYASIDKLLNPANFAQVIYHYKVLPVELVNLAAIIMPWLELILGVFLIFGIWVETAAGLAGVFTFFFIMLMGSAMARGLNIECGCFSLNPEASMVGWRRIIEDLLMLGGCVYLLIYDRTVSVKI
ncbi:MAG: DoxX family membrane protein [Candidatus Marinimicrobia bacterium]|nr:DoxX family membrane protein [Candidatus Neomarinimicrobiota bacterium]